MGGFFRGKPLPALLDSAALWETGLKGALAARQTQPPAGAPQPTPPNTPQPHEVAIQAFRHGLSAVYSVVLLNDAELAADHGVEQKLWQLYYQDIQEVKNAVIKAKPQSTAGAGSGKTILSATYTRQRARLERSIKLAEGSFIDMVEKMWRSYGLPSDTASFSQAIPTVLCLRGLVAASHLISQARLDGVAESARRPKHQAPYAYSCCCTVFCCLYHYYRVVCLRGCARSAIEKAIDSIHRFIIALGDLTRYKEHTVDGSKRAGVLCDALELYRAALTLSPSGKAHSQASVVFGNAQSVFLALYHLCRSMSAVDPTYVNEQVR